MTDLTTIAARLESELSRSYDDNDFTRSCASALSIIKDHPREVLRLAHARLYAFPFKDVPACWRRLYCEASLWLAHTHLREVGYHGDATSHDVDKTVSEVIRVLDTALIMTGAPGRILLINSVMDDIAGIVSRSYEPASKRRRKHSHSKSRGNVECVPTSFAPLNNGVYPPLRRPIKRAEDLSLPQFQDYLLASHVANDNKGPLPMIISGSISTWPAMRPRFWSDPQYLLSRTVNGRRVVPVELGKSYTDEAWGQKLQTMREFVENNMFVSHVPAGKREYLAQHDLFAQMPSLRDDVLIPDYCYSSPPKRAAVTRNQGCVDNRTSGTIGSNSDSDFDDNDSNGDVILNAWLGPAHTVSPAHTDPHHNILAQVVGHKYVRLFPPDQTSKMYPRGNEIGINMSNTSRVDVGRAMQLHEKWHGWNEFDDIGDGDVAFDNTNIQFDKDFPEFASVQYVEGVLAPGDCLYIPEGWWHYVRSLSPSFSVSFWWD